MKTPTPVRPDWITKTFAGAVLGLGLSYALVALFAWYGPGGIDAPNKVQFNMWAIAPLWLLFFSLVYLFATGWRALMWYGWANVLLWSFFLACHPAARGA